MDINAAIREHLTPSAALPYKLYRVVLDQGTGNATLQPGVDLNLYDSAVDRLDGQGGWVNISRSTIDTVDLDNVQTGNIYQCEIKNLSLTNCRIEFRDCKITGTILIRGGRVTFTGCQFAPASASDPFYTLDDYSTVRVEGAPQDDRLYGRLAVETRFPQDAVQFLSAHAGTFFLVQKARLHMNSVGECQVNGLILDVEAGGYALVENVYGTWMSQNGGVRSKGTLVGRNLSTLACQEGWVIECLEHGVTALDGITDILQLGTAPAAINMDQGRLELRNVKQFVKGTGGSIQATNQSEITLENISTEGGFIKGMDVADSTVKAHNIKTTESAGRWMIAQDSDLTIDTVDNLQAVGPAFELTGTTLRLDNVKANAQLTDSFIKILDGDCTVIATRMGTLSGTKHYMEVVNGGTIALSHQGGALNFASAGLIKILSCTAATVRLDDATVTCLGPYVYMGVQTTLTESGMTVNATGDLWEMGATGSVAIYGGTYTSSGTAFKTFQGTLRVEKASITASSDTSTLTDIAVTFREATLTLTGTVTLDNAAIHSEDSSITSTAYTVSGASRMQSQGDTWVGDWTLTEALRVHALDSTFDAFESDGPLVAHAVSVTISASSVASVQGVFIACSGSFTALDSGDLLLVGTALTATATGAVKLVYLGDVLPDKTLGIGLSATVCEVGAKVSSTEFYGVLADQSAQAATIKATDDFALIADQAGAKTRTLAIGGEITHELV